MYALMYGLCRMACDNTSVAAVVLLIVLRTFVNCVHLVYITILDPDVIGEYLEY